MIFSLVLVALAESAPKPAALKWSQFLDGSLTAVFQLKRGASELCEGETATVEDSGLRLKFEMTCSGEPYSLSVLMPHAVMEERVTVRRVRAEAHVTLHKDDPGVWWSSLARHPEQYKTLVQRDTQRAGVEQGKAAAAFLHNGTAQRRSSLYAKTAGPRSVARLRHVGGEASGEADRCGVCRRCGHRSCARECRRAIEF